MSCREFYVRACMMCLYERMSASARGGLLGRLLGALLRLHLRLARLPHLHHDP